MKLAYVSGPYSATSEWERYQNIHRMAEVAHRLWRMGIAAICPDCNTAHFGHDDIPYARFLDGDKIMIERSDLIVMIPGWDRSYGASTELAHARITKVPVYYWPQDLDKLASIAQEAPGRERTPTTSAA